MAEAQKDTIYIDVDDEITAVIEKVRASKHRIVALVLPKRATVLHSIVNMKLLHRTADEFKKHVVLISSDTVMVPIAGAVGMYVAKTLQTKPEIPPAPEQPDESMLDETADVADEDPLDKQKTVGELAGLAEDETIEMDSDDVAAAETAGKVKKSKKIKIPNFNKFRTKSILAGALVVILIVGWYLAYFVLPRATVVIKTDTQSVTSSLSPKISSKATELDEDKLVIPAVIKELKKTETEKSPATGQKDIGEKSTGTVVLYNCSEGDKLSDKNRTLPAGTVVKSGTYSFALENKVIVEPSSFNAGTGACLKNKASPSTPVTATSAGDSNNISARADYTVSGYPSMSGEGSAMSGGTSELIKTVSQNDIDSAKQRLANKTSEGVTDELQTTMQQEGLFGLVDSLETGKPEVKSNPALNEEASEVSVTSTITYQMVGVKAEYIHKLIENDVKKKIDTSQQSILNDGFDDAVLRIFDKQSTGEFTLSMQVAATTGPEINPDDLKKEIAGKKRSEAQTIIQDRPGVTDVNIQYSPFWVYATPKQTSKISIQFQDTKPEPNANNQ